jgi:hypothetical protein
MGFNWKDGVKSGGNILVVYVGGPSLHSTGDTDYPGSMGLSLNVAGAVNGAGI